MGDPLDRFRLAEAGAGLLDNKAAPTTPRNGAHVPRERVEGR